MAVQQNRKTPSKRGMRRSHDGLKNPSLSVEQTTGETHLRHHISPDGSPQMALTSLPGGASGAVKVVHVSVPGSTLSSWTVISVLTWRIHSIWSGETQPTQFSGITTWSQSPVP